MRLASEKNRETNQEFARQLVKIKPHFAQSSIVDKGDGRNSVNHGYMHPRFGVKIPYEI